MDEAIGKFYRILDEEPDNARAYESLGRCYVLKKDFAKAVANLDSAIWLNPKSATAFLLRGSANFNLNYKERALDDLQAALKLDPKNVEALSWLAYAHVTSGQFREAQDDCTELLSLNPHSIDGFFFRCFANLQLGDFTAARADYRAAEQHGLNAESLKVMQNWFKSMGQSATAADNP